MCDQFSRRVRQPPLTCPCKPPPYTVYQWACGWWLVGDGPSYLLYRSEADQATQVTVTQVTHLISGDAVPHSLREALNRVRAIKDGNLDPLVHALIQVNTHISPRDIEDAIRAKAAGDTVLEEIQRLLHHCPDEAIFAAQLARFATLLRAARRYSAEHLGPDVEVTFDDERSKYSVLNRHGHEVEIGDYLAGAQPARVFRCVPHSRVATCAQKLLCAEQASFGKVTSLYRVPTRKELRLHLCRSEPDITKLCQSEGFDWLPRAIRGG